MKTEDLDNLIQQLEKLNRFLMDQDGKEVLLDKETVFTKGPYLHQDTDSKSEEQSASEERDNPKLFKFMQSLNEQIEDIF